MMNLKKIKGYDKPCTSNRHNPPIHLIYDINEFQYICPECGKITLINNPEKY